MNIVNSMLYGTDGRLRGSYVYMLVCHDGSSIYVKAGKSCAPLRRLDELRHSCPISPRYLYTAHVSTNTGAKEIERELHAAFKPWHHNGEWYKLEAADKDAFNAAWREVLDHYSRPSWPLSWTKLNVRAIAAAARSRRGLIKKRIRNQLRRGGRAYEDFLRQSQN